MATFGDSTLAGAATSIIDIAIKGGYFQMGATGGPGDSITAKIVVTTASHKIKCAIYKADNSYFYFKNKFICGAS